MPAWFDVSSLEKLTDSASEDVAGLTSSASAIQSVILQSSLDLAPGRTVVGGFSQGEFYFSQADDIVVGASLVRTPCDAIISSFFLS